MNWLERALVVAVTVPFVIGSTVAGAEPDRGEEVFRFQDPAIVESSGLVVSDGRFVTVNDSGDSGRIFLVDGSGRTIGTTTWGEAEDIEALAAAGDGQVLVGDIGDNQAQRDTVQLLRVPYGEGEETVAPVVHDIAYPDGPQDAEALLVHPRSGRVLVASKGLMAGVLYEAPKRLSTSEVNTLRPVRDIPGLVTGGAFFPDGRHFLLRTYGRAIVYTYPGLALVGDLELPEQQQGEAIALDEVGDVYASSEGVQAPVLRIDLPRRLERALEPPPPGPSGSPSSDVPSGEDAAPDGSEADEPSPDEVGRTAWPWLLGGLVGMLVVAVLVRSLRPR